MLILKKLEQEELVHHRKGLILDPQRNHHHHLHLYQQLLNSRQEEKEEDQEIQIGFHGFHQNHHQLQQNREIPPPDNRVLHGGLGGPARQPPRPQKKRPYLPSSVDQLTQEGEEYAPRLPEKMGESYQYHNQQLQQQQQQQQQQASGSSRLGLRGAGGGGGGEIVEVQGGHIVRSTGRKDRHSKVCTAKGPRDRRVRLSAHTAIQFYDVQDRLGYDRPSKAVDWLIKKAKAAIDELAELPAWKPTATTATTPNSTSIADFEQNPDQQNSNHHQLSHFEQHPDDSIVDNQMGNSQNSSFLPPSLDSDSIADTIKSFFPMGASSNPGNNTSSGMQFHQSFPPPDLLSRTSSRSQDLRLSLQSFQDPILQNHHHHHQQNEQGNNNNNNIFFDGSGWSDNQPGGFQRMVAWGGVGGGDAVSAGFVFSSQPSPSTPFLQPLFGQSTNNQLFNSNSQRGPLQSSNAPSFRAWIDPPPPFTGVAIDQHPTLAFHHPSSMSGFASGLGGFSGFRIPARIQGEEEEHDGISDKPSSASSDSRH